MRRYVMPPILLVSLLLSGCATTGGYGPRGSYDPCDRYTSDTATVLGVVGALIGAGVTGTWQGAALGGGAGIAVGAGGGAIASHNCKQSRAAAQQYEREHQAEERARRAEAERLRAEEAARQKRAGTTITEGSSYRTDDGTIRWREDHRWRKEEEGVPPGSGPPALQPYDNPPPYRR